MISKLRLLPLLPLMFFTIACGYSTPMIPQHLPAFVSPVVFKPALPATPVANARATVTIPAIGGTGVANPAKTVTNVPVTTVPTPTSGSQTKAPTYLIITSNPPGAQVEVGVHNLNYVTTFGNGRMVGPTPLKVQIFDSDLEKIPEASHPGNSHYTLTCNITIAGLGKNIFILSLGSKGLEPGKTYSIEADIMKKKQV